MYVPIRAFSVLVNGRIGYSGARDDRAADKEGEMGQLIGLIMIDWIGLVLHVFGATHTSSISIWNRCARPSWPASGY